MKYKKLLLVAICLLPTIALANVSDVPDYNVPTSVPLEQLVTRVINWAFGLLILLAAVFIIVAAFIYLSSGGNEDKVKAKNYITYAAVAILVGFLAKAIVTIITRLIGA